MKKFICLLVLLLFGCFLSFSKTLKTEKDSLQKSKLKLVIGIVVDQMRYDYLTRFYNKFSNDGFKLLMKEGFQLKNNHYNYIPTYTGPGHAAIFTGATPKTNGIIANYWYDKHNDETVYCAGDTNVNSVGTNHKAGKMSSHRMLTTTFGDENRLFTQFKGKTIGVSLKDRGAILPAGHTANAAYWFHGKKEGKFITSDFYMTNLPNWVKQFNASNKAKSYLKEWNTLLPITSYTESGEDLNEFEGGFDGKKEATFPYDLKKLSNKNGHYDILKATPFGNSLLTDFAIEAIKQEQLGKDNNTDVLTVSFSSTDYVGHNFGVNSKEIQDTYIRLDRDIARLIQALNVEVGKGNYTLFLTSDHGAVDVPSYLKSKKIPAGYVSKSDLKKHVDSLLKTGLKIANVVKNISNNQIFLDEKTIKAYDFNLNDIEAYIARNLVAHHDVNQAYTSTAMKFQNYSEGEASLLQNGYNHMYSGNVVYSYKPNFIRYSKTGSTHGSGLNYDTHVPLLFYGNGIKKGSSFQKTEITSIAPTISALLGISFPNGSSNKVLDFIME